VTTTAAAVPTSKLRRETPSLLGSRISLFLVFAETVVTGISVWQTELVPPAAINSAGL